MEFLDTAVGHGLGVLYYYYLYYYGTSAWHGCIEYDGVMNEMEYGILKES